MHLCPVHSKQMLGPCTQARLRISCNNATMNMNIIETLNIDTIVISAPVSGRACADKPYEHTSKRTQTCARKLTPDRYFSRQVGTGVPRIGGIGGGRALAAAPTPHVNNTCSSSFPRSLHQGRSGACTEPQL